MQLEKDDGIVGWRKLMGPWPKIRESPCSSPTNVNAKLRGPQTIRAIYGIDGMRNAVHGSDSVEAAQKEIEIFFGPNNALNSACDLKDTTLCIIKPHVMNENLAGKVIDQIIKAGFDITAAEMFPSSHQVSEKYPHLEKEIN